MRNGFAVALLMGVALAGVYQIAVENQKGGASTTDQPMRAFESPNTDRVAEATDNVMLVMAIGMLGFIVLILGKFIWYEPRFFQLPFRPTQIVKSFRSRALDKASRESVGSESIEATEESVDDFDFEAFYQRLQERSDE